MRRRDKNVGRRLHASVLAIAATLVLPADAREQSAVAPLFAEDSLLEVTITAAFDTLMRDRPDVEYLTGTFEYKGSNGTLTVLDLKLRTRGNYRRDPEHCDFAPIRLNFRKSQVADTVFAGQDKLKLVTHCRSGEPHFENYVLREYLAYRLYNALTPVSYGVRLLRITYSDVESGESLTRLGFVIEHDDAVAERNGFQVVKTARVRPEDIEPRQQNLVHVFSYMIGNTEYSLLYPEPDKHCCHNTDVLSAGGGPSYVHLPFDFDFAGLVDAPYAEPNPRYPIRSVRTRHYKGLCANNDLLPDTVQVFHDSRGEFDRTIDSYSHLSKYSARLVREYVNSFFGKIENPEKMQKALADKCYESGR